MENWIEVEAPIKTIVFKTQISCRSRISGATSSAYKVHGDQKKYWGCLETPATLAGRRTTLFDQRVSACKPSSGKNNIWIFQSFNSPAAQLPKPNHPISTLARYASPLSLHRCTPCASSARTSPTRSSWAWATTLGPPSRCCSAASEPTSTSASRDATAPTTVPCAPSTEVMWRVRGGSAVK